jgi:prepilin-type N-terminal cleavage/methylation domain-containing protein
MRISATGKGDSGYTLLEILAVLLLIGLLFSLAQPGIWRTGEKNRMRYVGELLQSDAQRILAEAQAGNTVQLSFDSHGYRICLGDTVTTRDYRAGGIAFRLESQATPASGLREDRENAAEPEDTTGDGPELDFVPDRPGPAAAIIWESEHYRGELTLKTNEALSWGYHAK